MNPDKENSSRIDNEDIPPIVIDQSNGEPEDFENSEPEMQSFDPSVDITNRPPRPTDYKTVNSYLRSLKGLRNFLLP